MADGGHEDGAQQGKSEDGSCTECYLYGVLAALGGSTLQVSEYKHTLHQHQDHLPRAAAEADLRAGRLTIAQPILLFWTPPLHKLFCARNERQSDVQGLNCHLHM